MSKAVLPDKVVTSVACGNNFSLALASDGEGRPSLHHAYSF
jgi:hypothetical protein